MTEKEFWDNEVVPTYNKLLEVYFEKNGVRDLYKKEIQHIDQNKQDIIKENLALIAKLLKETLTELEKN
jgi:hypothetical protein